MKAGIAVLVLAGAFSTGVSAQGMNYGLGTQGCGKYVAAAEQDKRGDSQAVYMYMTWMSGFISHASLLDSIEYFKGTDTESVQLWLENYCRANPLETFNTAVLKLMATLTKK